MTVATSTFGSVLDTNIDLQHPPGTTGARTHITSPTDPVAAVVDDVLLWSTTWRATLQQAQDQQPPMVIDVPPPPAAPAAALPLVGPPAAARPVASAPPLVIGSAQQALINADRAAAGLPPLNWSGCLAGIAAAQAQAMAATGTIFHGNGVHQDWTCGLSSGQTGENVGVWGAGINDAGINQLFMASAGHRANILGPYSYVGTAWVVSGGKGYIAVEFA